MSHGETTCWTMVRGAAAGDEADRRAFAERYAGAVRAYLLARWSRSPLAQEIDDAIQEVFVESFRAGGALERVDPDRSGGFRAFFYGIVRNVARRFEQRGARTRETPAAPDTVEAFLPDEARLSRVFDRAWARDLMREAASRQDEHACAAGPEARRRVDLLRLRFGDGLPIRTIAGLWTEDPAHLHREYATARQEFRSALEAVVREQLGREADAIDRECTYLLGLLG